MLQFPEVPLSALQPRGGTTNRVRVVVVDEAHPGALVDVLELGGYSSDVVDASRAHPVPPADIVVLGPGLASPRRLQLISTLAQSGAALVLDVAAQDLPIVRARALRAGADDAVAWNATPDELLARVDALARRLGRERASGAVAAGAVTVDPVTHEVTVDGFAVEMTAKEFDLLHLLTANPGRVFTRDELLAKVWRSSAAYQSAATVTEHVRRLRVKLGRRAGMLQTVRGVGYRFERRSAPRPPVELLHAG